MAWMIRGRQKGARGLNRADAPLLPGGFRMLKLGGGAGAGTWDGACVVAGEAGRLANCSVESKTSAGASSRI
jgi:hypothetical protein